MSEDAKEPQSNSELIQVAALLSAAALNDDRMAPLAKTARKLVLDTESALDELFAGYLASKQAPPQASPTIVARTDPNSVALALVEQAKSLIENKQ